MEDYLAKVNYNKKTNQAIIFLSKKKLLALKLKKAKFLKVHEEDLVF